MKKLMIAAAIVCAAVVSQAATTMWAANTGTKNWYAGYLSTETTPTTELLKGATVYLIAATAASENFISQADLVDAFQSATTEKPFSLANYAVKGSAGATTTDAGRLTGSGHKIDGFSNTGDFANSTSYDFYLATLVTVGGKDYLYVTDSVPKTSGANDTTTVTINTFDPATTSKAFYGDAEYSKAGWYTTAAVPEPTSGLLLLLGMAGLALRRRRA